MKTFTVETKSSVYANFVKSMFQYVPIFCLSLTNKEDIERPSRVPIPRLEFDLVNVPLKDPFEGKMELKDVLVEYKPKEMYDGYFLTAHISNDLYYDNSIRLGCLQPGDVLKIPRKCLSIDLTYPYERPTCALVYLREQKDGDISFDTIYEPKKVWKYFLEKTKDVMEEELKKVKDSEDQVFYGSLKLNYIVNFMKEHYANKGRIDDSLIGISKYKNLNNTGTIDKKIVIEFSDKDLFIKCLEGIIPVFGDKLKLQT